LLAALLAVALFAAFANGYYPGGPVYGAYPGGPVYGSSIEEGESSSLDRVSGSLEGVYEWTLGGGSDYLYICEQDNRIYGSYGEMGIFSARYLDIEFNTTTTITGLGRYFGVGWKFGGERISRRKWERTAGRVVLIHDSDSEELTINFYTRNEFDLTMQFVGARTSNDTTENGLTRVQACGIYNDTAETTISGQWTADNSTYVFDLCADADFTGSYSYEGTDGDTIYGYTVGKCYQNGQVCSADWYQGEIFGVEMYVQLLDGTLWNSYYNGAYASSNSTHGADLYERVSESSDNCTANSDQAYNPIKCNSFDNEFCESQEDFGFCVLNDDRKNSQGNSCFKTTFTL